MRFTAEDIRNQTFKNKFKGLDKADVMTYLDLVADDFEAFQEEVVLLKGQIKKRDIAIQKFMEREGKLKGLAASYLKEKRVTPEKYIKKEKSNGIVKSALSRAKEIKNITEKSVLKMEKEILMLEKHKKRVMESIRSKA